MVIPLNGILQDKHNLVDIIQMCQQGKARQHASQSDANTTSLYPEHILPYLVHTFAHHPSFPNLDECKEVKAYEPIYRYIWFLSSNILVIRSHGIFSNPIILLFKVLL